jgi:hypothetical protein
LELGQELGGLIGYLLVGHHVVAARLYPLHRGKVSLPTGKGMTYEAHDRSYDGSVDQPKDRDVEAEQTKKEPEDKPDHGSKARSLQRSPPVSHTPCHLLHEP